MKNQTLSINLGDRKHAQAIVMPGETIAVAAQPTATTSVPITHPTAKAKQAKAKKGKNGN